MIKLNYLIKLLLLIFIFNILGRNICAVSEQNIISYSFLISKELINQIASDRFGDQSADFINEITKKNINISKLRINHEGSSISFIISFNSFNIDRGDKYMIDKALTLPITEQITFDKYFMYSMVSKDYKPNLEDAKKIIDKDGRKIMLGKLGDDYEIVFKMKFRVNVDAILKNDQNQTWIIETPWEENDMDLYKNNSVSKEAFSGKSQDEILSYKAKAYVEAQKKREEEDSRREEELKAQYEKELMEKARIAKEMKHREEALKKLEEEKEKKEEEKQKSKEEQKRKDEEEKQKVQEEAARKKAQLLVEAKKREEEKREKERKKQEEENKLMEKQAEERARIVMEALKQREKRYKLEEEVKILEEQASIEYEKKKKEEERKKKEELKRRDEERKYEEERIKKMQDEERRLKEHAERKKLEEKKIADELAMKKEEEKKLTLQARVPGAIVSQEIISKRSFREPEIDGNPEPSIWQNIQPYLIVTKNKSEREKLIIIKSIYANDYIFFYLQWEDNTENVTHKTWIWNKDKKQYEIGGDHEDKVALMFGLGNSFDACMLRGIIYEADVWEWGAARTNPAGFADDQKIIVSSERIRRANSYRAKNGRNIWIKFIFDQGEPCYREDVVVDYKWDKVPRYSSCFPTESRADIKAKGIWKEGIWQVEFKRKLNTKDKDNDIVFNTRKEYLFGVAIFDHDKQINHYTSDNLILKFVQ